MGKKTVKFLQISWPNFEIVLKTSINFENDSFSHRKKCLGTEKLKQICVKLLLLRIEKESKKICQKHQSQGWKLLKLASSSRLNKQFQYARENDSISPAHTLKFPYMNVHLSLMPNYAQDNVKSVDFTSLHPVIYVRSSLFILVLVLLLTLSPPHGIYNAHFHFPYLQAPNKSLY